jgi:senataxin
LPVFILLQVLWELETLRLVSHFEKSMKAEAEDDDDLYIVDNNGEEQLFDCSGQDFENKLRVPLFEILKYPYLLLHERVSEYLGCISLRVGVETEEML